MQTHQIIQPLVLEHASQEAICITWEERTTHTAPCVRALARSVIASHPSLRRERPDSSREEAEYVLRQYVLVVWHKRVASLLRCTPQVRTNYYTYGTFNLGRESGVAPLTL
jgi:hypothetical protein